jgi:hypothetical protein
LKEVAMRASLLLVVVAVLVSPAVAQESPPEPEAPYLVIVHPSNAVASLSREFLTNAFLKRTTRWPAGGAIVPADLAPRSAVRRRFTEDVLGRTVEAVRFYWQQVVFSGRGVPPIELDGDEAAVRFVLSNPGGVAYVSGSADVSRVNVVTIQ